MIKNHAFSKKPLHKLSINKGFPVLSSPKNTPKTCCQKKSCHVVRVFLSPQFISNYTLGSWDWEHDQSDKNWKIRGYWLSGCCGVTILWRGLSCLSAYWVPLGGLDISETLVSMLLQSVFFKEFTSSQADYFSRKSWLPVVPTQHFAKTTTSERCVCTMGFLGTPPCCQKEQNRYEKCRFSWDVT